MSVSEPNPFRMEPLKKIVEATDLLNRELSWLEFNARVLHEAADAANPLLERLKFIAIFDSNLDEFFMKRVGGLKQQLASNVRELDPGTDGTPLQQLAAINAKARPMVARQRRLLNHELLPALRQHGLEMLSWDELRAGERRQLSEEFDRQFFPVLTPLAVDPAHPFPFISNVSLSLAVSIRSPGDAAPRFARVKAPHILPRWVQVPKTLRFVPLEEVIAHNLDRLFPGMEVVESYPFRVTRNADVQRNEETAEDLLEAIQEELRERRFATVVRLEVARGMPRWMLELLFEELEIVESEVYEVEGPLALRDLIPLAGSVPLPSLRYRPWTPATHPRFSHSEDEETGVSGGVFGAIAAGDILVHHPYDSFATSVQRFIEAAADDPAVFAIKQTLYRTSAESPNMQALIRAAEARKQIAVTVEIKARFDEAANIEWAEALEGVGAHVCYGVVGLKTHAKIALVVRQEKEGLRSYVHVATGNYNPETAKLYTDLGLFTVDQEIAQDVAQLFNMLTGFASIFLLSALALMGHQPAVALGVEWLVVAALALAINTYGYIQAFRLRSSLYALTLIRIVGGSLCYLAQLVGAVLLICGIGVGITVGAVAVVATFVYLISGSWLLIMGTITTADSLVACAVNGGAAFATIGIVQPGSAAGQVNTALPTAATYANENDSVAFTPSGAGGANISAAFSLTIRQL